MESTERKSLKPPTAIAEHHRAANDRLEAYLSGGQSMAYSDDFELTQRRLRMAIARTRRLGRVQPGEPSYEDLRRLNESQREIIDTVTYALRELESQPVESRDPRVLRELIHCLQHANGG